jgi:hypothetical protein
MKIVRVALALKLLYSDDFCSMAYIGVGLRLNKQVAVAKVKEIIDKIRSEGCVMKILNNDIHTMSVEVLPCMNSPVPNQSLDFPQNIANIFLIQLLKTKLHNVS